MNKKLCILIFPFLSFFFSGVSLATSEESNFDLESILTAPPTPKNFNISRSKRTFQKIESEYLIWKPIYFKSKEKTEALYEKLQEAIANYEAAIERDEQLKKERLAEINELIEKYQSGEINYWAFNDKIRDVNRKYRGIGRSHWHYRTLRGNAARLYGKAKRTFDYAEIRYKASKRAYDNVLAKVKPILDRADWLKAHNVTCVGSTCNGVDPQKSNCSEDATTTSQGKLEHNGVTYAKVEYRWSESCKSAWTKVTLTNPLPPSSNVSAEIYDYYDTGNNRYITSLEDKVFSPMAFPKDSCSISVKGKINLPSGTIEQSIYNDNCYNCESGICQYDKLSPYVGLKLPNGSLLSLEDENIFELHGDYYLQSENFDTLVYELDQDISSYMIITESEELNKIKNHEGVSLAQALIRKKAKRVSNQDRLIALDMLQAWTEQSNGTDHLSLAEKQMILDISMLTLSARPRLEETEAFIPTEANEDFFEGIKSYNDRENIILSEKCQAGKKSSCAFGWINSLGKIALVPFHVLYTDTAIAIEGCANNPGTNIECGSIALELAKIKVADEVLKYGDELVQPNLASNSISSASKKSPSTANYNSSVNQPISYENRLINYKDTGFDSASFRPQGQFTSQNLHSNVSLNVNFNLFGGKKNVDVNSKNTLNNSWGYTPPPKKITGIPNLYRVSPKTPVQGGGGLRKRWKDPKGNIYEWDSQHGTLEKYNKKGKHLGEFNPYTGMQTKKSNNKRKIEP